MEQDRDAPEATIAVAEAAAVATSPFEIVAFWREAGADRWFATDTAFDTAFRTRFQNLHMSAAARLHDGLIETADGALALLLLTDQFPRNAFRGTGHMYATDSLARHYARAALAAGHMDRVAPELQLFFCLPFAHSEDRADQDRSVALTAPLGLDSLSYAMGHRAIVYRFGRFPHRNAILARQTTADEAAFLAAGGFTG
jgi:uncharacterized protein (DUF924 family)